MAKAVADTTVLWAIINQINLEASKCREHRQRFPFRLHFTALCKTVGGFSLEEGRYFFNLISRSFKKAKKQQLSLKYCPLFLPILWPARTEVKRQIVAIGEREAQFIYTVIQGREPHTSFNQASLHIRSRPEDSSIWNNLFGHETKYINLWLNFRTHVTAQM